MIVIANRPLPTLGVAKDESLRLSHRDAVRLLAKGIVRRPIGSERRPADEQGPLPSPLAGSPTGEVAPASSSDRGRAPKKPASIKRKAAPRS